MPVATNSKVLMFNLSDGKVTATNSVFKSHFGKVALFSPDGKTLFIPDSYKVTGFLLKSKKSPDVVDLGEIPRALAYCEQTHEVIASGSGKIHIIDWREETRTGVLSTGSQIAGYVTNVTISHNVSRYL